MTSIPLTEADLKLFTTAHYQALDNAQLSLQALRNQIHAYENDNFVLTLEHRKKLMAARALLASLRNDIKFDMVALLADEV